MLGTTLGVGVMVGGASGIGVCEVVGVTFVSVVVFSTLGVGLALVVIAILGFGAMVVASGEV